jgi:hypothetical protein
MAQLQPQPFQRRRRNFSRSHFSDDGASSAAANSATTAQLQPQPFQRRRRS